MQSSHEVVVGQRRYLLEFIEPGRWVVSRGGIPTGYIRQRNGECSVSPLVEGEAASDELSGVLEEAKQQAWWR